MNILVLGGAGYIGSHCVHGLQQKGYQPVVLDNLSTGHREAIAHEVPFYLGDIGDKTLVRKILKKEHIDCVMHFAAYALVPESVQHPLRYFQNNLSATCNALEAMLESNVKSFIFSSTCATYGTPEILPIKEDTPQKPINPYGQTKLYVEQLLQNLAISDGLKSASFRYFNASGAAPHASQRQSPQLGENHSPETHLIPNVLLTALGQKPYVEICGTDYPTPDGTCLRDYVHVNDICSAHILGLDFLQKMQDPKATYFNLGTGKPYSVKEVVQACEKVVGKAIPTKAQPRRPGDPHALYANADLARKTLGWQPKYTSLEPIVETAWEWHQAQNR